MTIFIEEKSFLRTFVAQAAPVRHIAQGVGARGVRGQRPAVQIALPAVSA
jgi:hypothetical protein